MTRTGLRPRRARWIVAGVVLAVAGCDFGVGANAGQLDAGFGGGDGTAVVDGFRVRTDDSMQSAVRLPDGRVVASALTAGTDGAVLTRFLPDGTPDGGFGQDGRASVALVPSADIAAAPTGEILVPGRIGSGASQAWGVARVLPDGEPQPGFGTGGIAVLPGAGSGAATLGVAGSGDRTYLLARAVPPGGGASDTVLAAFGPDGALDPGFGPAGTGVLALGVVGGSGRVAVAPDGNLIVAYGSRSTTPGTEAAGVMRISPEGEVLAHLDLLSAPSLTKVVEIDDLYVAPDGSVAVVGNDRLGTLSEDYSLYAYRLTPELGFAPGFGGAGPVPLHGSLRESWIGAFAEVVVDASGRVVVAGGMPGPGEFAPLATVALAADGSVDPGWGSGAPVSYTPSTSEAIPAGLFVTPGGVVIAGEVATTHADPSDQFLLAIGPDGAPDADFGDGGWARANRGADAAGERLTAGAELPGGDLFVAGDTGDGVIAGRYDADGSPDPSFPPRLLLPDRLRGNQGTVGVSVGGDGSVYVVGATYQGSGARRFAVVKLLPGGAVDTAYGDGGLAVFGGVVANLIVVSTVRSPRAIAVRPDGSVVVTVTDFTPAFIVPGGPGRPPQSFPATSIGRVLTVSPGGVPADPAGSFANAGPMPVAVGSSGDAYFTVAGSLQRFAPDGTLTARGPLPTGAALDARQVAVDGSGRVLVYGAGNPPGGTASTDVVARFDAALGLDPSYGAAGFAAVANAGEPGGTGLAAAADGTATLLDHDTVDGKPQVRIVRLDPTGQADPSFHSGRVVGTLRVGGRPVSAVSLSLAGTDIVLTGQVPDGGGGYIARING